MSVSSVSATPPVAPVQQAQPARPPEPKIDNGRDDSRTAPLPPPAPLPPGQGTRIDQLA